MRLSVGLLCFGLLLVGALSSFMGAQRPASGWAASVGAQTNLTTSPVVVPTPTSIVPGGPGFLMLGAADLDPLNINVGVPNSTVANRLIPLHLPQGAEITQLVAFYEDRASDVRPGLQLHRQYFGTIEIIAEMPFPPVDFVGGDNVASVKVTAAQRFVDNERYSYYLRVLSPTSANPTAQLGFYQIRVDYAFTVNTPDIQR